MSNTQGKDGREQPLPTEGRGAILPSDPDRALRTVLHNNNPIKEIYNTLPRNVIVIDEDKLGHFFQEPCEIEERNRWKDPLSIFSVLITLLVTLTTATFHDVFFVSAQILRELCISASFVVAFFLMRSVVKALKKKPRRLEDIIREIKGVAVEGNDSAETIDEVM